MRRRPWWRLRVGPSLGFLLVLALVGIAIASATGTPTVGHRAAPVPQTAAGPSRATPGAPQEKETGPGVAHVRAGKPRNLRPHELHLTRARGPVFDVRKLKSTV